MIPGVTVSIILGLPLGGISGSGEGVWGEGICGRGIARTELEAPACNLAVSIDWEAFCVWLTSYRHPYCFWSC